MSHQPDTRYDDLPVHALIVSAGRGSRFGTDIPKQYLNVAGRTVLEHSVACLNTSKITDLTLVVAKDDGTVSSLPFDFDEPIHLTCGGAERFLSVKAGVDSIGQRVTSDVWVLIHDAARPCLPKEDVNRLIGAAHQLQKQSLTHTPSVGAVGAILATPVVDTLKLVQNDENAMDGIGGLIQSTIDRRHLWQAQTPQIFRLHALQKMLDKVITHQLMITDEASGFEQFGESVVLVQGSRFNIKLTYPEDLAMIELILNHTHPNPAVTTPHAKLG